MNQALVGPPGTQTYIKEFSEGKVEPNPKKVNSFPFSRACPLVQSLPVCSHFGIEAYPYTSVNGGEWENGASGHHPCTLFHFVGFFHVPSLWGGARLFRSGMVLGRDGGFDWSGSRTSVVVNLFRCTLSLAPGNLGTCTPCIHHHSCVNRDFRNVIEAWTRHASLHVSEKREIIGRFRQSLSPRDLPEVVLHPEEE